MLTTITVFTRNVKEVHLDPDYVSAAEPNDLLKHISTGEEAMLVTSWRPTRLNSTRLIW